MTREKFFSQFSHRILKCIQVQTILVTFGPLIAVIVSTVMYPCITTPFAFTQTTLEPTFIFAFVVSVWTAGYLINVKIMKVDKRIPKIDLHFLVAITEVL